MSITHEFYASRLGPSMFDSIAIPSRHTSKFIADELRDLPRNSQVLDVGIGTGLISERLSRSGNINLDGTDPSPEMLNKAQQRVPLADLRVGSAEQIPFDNDTYDAVLLVHVLKHVPASNTSQVVSEISRVAKPSAVVLVSDLMLPSFKPKFLRSAPDEKILGVWAQKQEFIDTMSKSGFVLTKTRYPFASFLMRFDRGS
jgi:ubiquinone/menaquinone biosynthesis C-methylase UbiE